MLFRKNPRGRRGTATIELAVCLPVMVLLTFGTIETTSLIALRQRLATAAYEAVRTASAPQQTSAAGIAAGTSILTARSISGATITISPNPVTSSTVTGTEISSTVVAPFASNTCMSPFLIGNFVTNVTVTVTMIRQ